MESFPVPGDLDGGRADLAVARLAGVSRAVARRLVTAGLATVDGRMVAPREQVRAGAVVAVSVPDDESALLAEPVPFGVVYEDDSLIVVDKPAGVVVHPGAGNLRGTLMNGLLHHAPQLVELPRAGIVHRLDKETSGCLVAAKTDTAHHALARRGEQAFRRR